MTLEAIKYSDGKLEILDQLLLPNETVFIKILNTKDGWRAIRDMQVRGAPAIAVVGVLSLVAEIFNMEFGSVEELHSYVTERLNYLVTARPTAVNMADARNKMTRLMNSWNADGDQSVTGEKKRLIGAMEDMQQQDVAANLAMGRYGADSMVSACGAGPLSVLTHCNTGSLATAGYGTALGVVRTLHSRGVLDHCYCTETRPYNQGARLTAYELVHDSIPSTLICDDMVAALMTRRGVSAVVTGADRVAANGDTANKIGTYQIAVLARYHNVPFYIAAPSTTVDLTMTTGADIVIEERPQEEMTTIKGISIAAKGIQCWNPAFDVTPAKLITGGIITEYGVYKPTELKDAMSKALGP